MEMPVEQDLELLHMLLAVEVVLVVQGKMHLVHQHQVMVDLAEHHLFLELQ
jgi:hypothetical protein